MIFERLDKKCDDAKEIITHHLNVSFLIPCREMKTVVSYVL